MLTMGPEEEKKFSESQDHEIKVQLN